MPQTTTQIAPFYLKQSDLARQLSESRGGTVQAWRDKVSRAKPETIPVTLSATWTNPETGESELIVVNAEVVRTPAKFMK